MSIFSTHLEQIDSRFAVAFESIVIMPVHSCMCQSFSVQKTDDQVMDGRVYVEYSTRPGHRNYDF